MKTIRLFAILVFSILCLAVSAKKVPVEKARTAARNFIQAQARQAGMSNADGLEPVLTMTGTTDGEPMYYVFNFSLQTGYIMLSATDAVTPVLCFSLESPWVDIDQIESPETREWMKVYREYLHLMITENSAPAPEVAQLWETLGQPMAETTINSSMVSPLLHTTWNQGSGYNKHGMFDYNCTLSCQHNLTGCVATALAQLLKYWNYPEHGSAPTGTVCVTNSAGTLCSNFNSVYDWDGMYTFCNPGSDCYYDYCPGIAELMKDCGVAVLMDYGCGGSSAHFNDYGVSALVDHFNMDAVAHLEREQDHGQEVWQQVMKLNLLAGFPILYSGFPDEGDGHCWVVDGFYDVSSAFTYFHHNWGWGGTSNGYFVNLALFVDGNDFTYKQSAIFDLHPAAGAQPLSPTDISASYTDNGGGFRDHINVHWRWASNATHYKVYRTTDYAHPEWCIAVSGWITDTLFNDYNVFPGQEFYYYVTSKSANLGNVESVKNHFSNGGNIKSVINLNNVGYMASCPDSTDFLGFKRNNQLVWSAIAVRSGTHATSTSLTAYADTNFASSPAQLAFSSGGPGKISLIMEDGTQGTIQERGYETHKLGSYNAAQILAYTADENISTGSYYNLTWSTSDIAKVWQCYLTPGRYYFTIEMIYGNLDPGMALFGSSAGTILKSLDQAMISTDANGNGQSETMYVTINIEGWYGLVMWSNSFDFGNYNLKIGQGGRWTGDYDDNWHNPWNWSGNQVPNSSDDVIIPENSLNFPRIYQANAECHNLVIARDDYVTASLTIQNHSLTVGENIDVYGLLSLNTNTSATQVIAGNFIFETNSSFSATASSSLHCLKNWTFKSNAYINLYPASVYFDGSLAGLINNRDNNSSFYHLIIDKQNNNLDFSYMSSRDLSITGNLNIGANSTFLSSCSRIVYLNGLLLNSGHFRCNNGKFILQNQNKDLVLNVGDYFNDLELGSVSLVTMLTDITIKGSLQIDSGPVTLMPSGNTIYISGNWVNNNGSTGFSTAGTVVFTGVTDQQCSNQNFGHLQINKTSGNLVITDATVNCIYYKWLSGGVKVESGTFGADHLEDNGISGNFIVEQGGTMNLHNPGGWVDLNGTLEIYGGTVNVYGGTTDSYWPYSADGMLIMTNGGTLDFKETGIYLYTGGTHYFTGDISGGWIRTTGSFRADGSNFRPDGGTVELYGPGTATVSTTNNAAFWNLTINKNAISGFAPANPALNNPHPEEQAEFADLAQFSAPGSNEADMNSTLYLRGNLAINNGALVSNNNNIVVNGSWFNQVGLGGFSCGTGTVTFNAEWKNQAVQTIEDYEQFYNLEIQAHGKTFTTFQPLFVAGNFHAISGTVAASYPNMWHEVAGNMIVDPQVNWNSEFGNFIFDGEDNQNLQFSPASGEFGSMYIDKYEDVELMMNSDIPCGPDKFLNVNLGILDLNGYRYDCQGNVMIGNGGVIYMPGGSHLATGLYKTLSVNNGGWLEAYGEPDAQVYLEPDQGYFRMNVEAGGTLSADYCVFTGLDTNGVNVKNGAFINQWYPMNNCWFVQGEDGGTLLTINNSQILTVDQAVFIEDNSSTNVRKDLNQGEITFTNFGGNFAGEAHENDPFDLIIWYGEPSVNATATPSSICVGSSSSLAAFVNNGTPPLIYEWSPVTGLSDPTSPFPMASPLTTTTYILTVFSGPGAFYTDTVTVHVLPLPVADAGANTTITSGSSAILGGYASGGSSPYLYQWSPTESLSSPYTQSTYASPPVTTVFTLSVTDANNCNDTAQVTVTVLPAGSQLNGTVRYDNTPGTFLSNVTVNLKNGSIVAATTTTNTAGIYNFSGVPPGTYTLDAICTKPWGGVNAADALVIMKHFVGSDTLEDVRFTAANLDGLYGINSIDALLAMKRFVGNITSFAVGDWAFEHPIVTFTGNNNITMNFKGLCFADVNGSYIPSAKEGAKAELVIDGEVTASETGEISLPLRIEKTESLGAISLVLNYSSNSIEILGIEPGNLLKSGNDNAFIYQLNTNQLRIAWYSLSPVVVPGNEALFTIKARLLPGKDLNFSIGEESSFADPKAMELPSVKLLMPQVVSGDQTFSLFPNPAGNTVSITYNLKETGFAFILLYNNLGQVIKTIQTEEETKGTHSFSFDVSNVRSGNYWLKMETITGNSMKYQVEPVIISH
ncbi:MAG: C10 family peptidase [Bacteroidetes bacterium]|nr:C10 family peptidase [Bacteroidota bacterium]